MHCFKNFSRVSFRISPRGSSEISARIPSKKFPWVTSEILQEQFSSNLYRSLYRRFYKSYFKNKSNDFSRNSFKKPSSNFIKGFLKEFAKKFFNKLFYELHQGLLMEFLKLFFILNSSMDSFENFLEINWDISVENLLEIPSRVLPEISTGTLLGFSSKNCSGIFSKNSVRIPSAIIVFKNIYRDSLRI